jgi:hypothetical protein
VNRVTIMAQKNRRNRRRLPKGYWPDEEITKIMRGLLWYQDDVAAGDVNKEHKRYLDKEKVRLLHEYVFPSMANIIFFFRSVSTYPQLKEVFENDIKDLLGVRRENPQPNNYGFIFSALVQSVLLTELDLLYLREEMPGEDFSLRLNQILQENVRARVNLALTKVLKDPAVQRIVADDFNRALGWTSMLAESAPEENKLPHKTIKFGIIQLREDDEPL